MIYVTGDTHGYVEYFSPENENYRKCEQNLKKDDTLIVCGDFGFVFFSIPDEEYIDKLYKESPDSKIYAEHIKNKYRYLKECENLDFLSKKPYTIAFLLGNHENYDRLYSDEFEKVDFCGGKAIKIRENIFGLLNNEVYTFENKKFFVLGGAASQDKAERKSYEALYNYKIHFQQELPCEKDLDRAREVLQEHNFTFDYILTHHAPIEYIYRLDATPKGDTEFSNFLQWIYETAKFKHFYFSHFHKDKSLKDNLTCCYEEILKLGE